MALARELVITYGSYSCSPDGQYTFSQTFDTFTLQFDFLVQSATAAGFATAYDSAADAFRKPFQNLTVVNGGSTLLSLSQSGDTGLEVRSEILKREHVANTGRSIRFTVRITCGLPADNVTTSGLREYGINVEYSPSRRRAVQLSGVWTAVGGTTARAGYEAGIGALVTSAKSDLSITNWELVSEPRTTTSYNNKTINFSRTYQEILYGQVGSGDDSDIVQQRVKISVSTTSQRFAGSQYARYHQIGDTGGGGPRGQALPFIQIRANYDCFVDFDQTTDLDGVWDRVKTWLINQMRTAGGGGAFAVTEISPQYSYDDNAISAQVVAIASNPNSNVLSRSFSFSRAVEMGVVLVPVWNGGDVFTKYQYPGAGRKHITTRVTTESISGGGIGGDAGGAGGASGGGGGNGFGWGGANIGFGVGFDLTPGNDTGIYRNPGSAPSGTDSNYGWTKDTGFTQHTWPTPSGASAPSSNRGSGLDGANIGVGVQPAAGGKGEALLRHETVEEPFEIGLIEGGAPIVITRTTTTIVREQFKEA